jgi:phospholipid transport system substrate-binding protein
MKRSILLVLLFLSLVQPVQAEEEDNKKAVATLIQTTVEKVLKVLGDKKTSRSTKRERTIKTIEPVIDFQLMAKLTLGRRHWPKFSTKQRETFTDLLVETLKVSYFEKLVLFTDEVVEYEDPVARGNKFEVVTYIVSKGERTVVVYKLYQRAGAWRVYDFEIEGVSIVRSYGSQHNDFLREKSVEKLLEVMKKKVDEARKREREKEKKEAGGKGEVEKKPGNKPESAGEHSD